MKVLAIIQARMGSTRLPQKVMKELGNTNVIGFLCNRISYSKYVDDIIVATSLNEENRPLKFFLEKQGVKVYCGSEDNVLQRFVDVIEEKEPEIVVRITGDNPLTCPYCIDYLILSHILRKADYSYLKDIPLGTSAEVVNANRLKEINSYSLEKYHREHVTIYLKEHPEKYLINYQETTDNLKSEQLRLTIDTPEDYQLVKYLVDNLGEEAAKLSLADILEFVRENPEIKQWNAHVKQKER